MKHSFRMKNTRAKKHDYSTPEAEVVEIHVENSLLAGTNEDIGGHDLAPEPLFPDTPMLPDLTF